MREPDFDATEWMALAETDPEEFEAQRRDAIDHLISQAPERLRQRLRCIQWRIEMERRKCATPLAACLKLNQMMWDFVFAEHGFVNTLNGLAGSPRKNTHPPARVLHFPGPAAKPGRP